MEIILRKLLWKSELNNYNLRENQKICFFENKAYLQGI